MVHGGSAGRPDVCVGNRWGKMMKTLRRKSVGLYAWRNLELSHLRRGTKLGFWNLAWTGSGDRPLPCGQGSRVFASPVAANFYLKQYGYRVEGIA